MNDYRSVTSSPFHCPYSSSYPSMSPLLTPLFLLSVLLSVPSPCCPFSPSLLYCPFSPSLLSRDRPMELSIFEMPMTGTHGTNVCDDPSMGLHLHTSGTASPDDEEGRGPSHYGQATSSSPPPTPPSRPSPPPPSPYEVRVILEAILRHAFILRVIRGVILRVLLRVFHPLLPPLRIS